MIFWKEFLILKERASLLPITFAPSGRMIERQRGTRTSPVYRELGLAIDFVIDNIYVGFGSSVFRQVIGIPMGTNSAPLLADLFLHTFDAPSYPYITYLLHSVVFQMYLGTCAGTILF